MKKLLNKINDWMPIDWIIGVFGSLFIYVVGTIVLLVIML